MPNIDVPTALADRITQVDMRLGMPQQSVLRSPWTGGVQILNRGYARWSGTAQIAPSGRPIASRHDEWGVIEAFFGSLQGAENTFDLPHHRPGAVLADNTTIVNSQTQGDGVLRHRLSAVERGLQVGQMINAGTQTYIVAEIQTGRWLVLYPQRVIANMTALVSSTTIRVRAAGSTGITSPLTPDRPGPWSLQWEEA